LNGPSWELNKQSYEVIGVTSKLEKEDVVVPMEGGKIKLVAEKWQLSGVVQ